MLESHKYRPNSVEMRKLAQLGKRILSHRGTIPRLGQHCILKRIVDIIPVQTPDLNELARLEGEQPVSLRLCDELVRGPDSVMTV